MKLVALACQDETARFCPWADPETIEPRDAYICLRVYKMNLSYNCRRAINAAAR